jgi:predicted lipid-binding transport protein (Tim44 family)
VGSAATLGRSLQWTMSSGSNRRNSSRNVQVMISPRNGRTTIRIEEPLSALAGGLFGGLMGGLGGGLSGPALGIGMGAFHSGSISLALIATAVSGSYLLARTIFGRIAHGRGERLQELMSRLAEHVSATAIVPPTLERPAERASLERGEPR